MKYSPFICLIFALTLMGFSFNSDYSPMSIIVKGKVINLKTKKPLRHFKIYLNDKMMDEVNFYPDNVLIDEGKTNSKGEFIIETFINKNDLQFWIKGIEFAQINVIVPRLDTSKNLDTVDLGTIYFVPYETGLQVTSYNMPKSRKRGKEKFEKFSIKEVDSIFSFSNNFYDIELKSIDTINALITRYNFGPENPRGTTIEKYKQVTFKKLIK